MYDFNTFRRLSWCAAALLAALAAGCSGDSILGADGRVATAPIAPAVTAVSPLNNAIGVPIGSTVALTFDKAQKQWGVLMPRDLVWSMDRPGPARGQGAIAIGDTVYLFGGFPGIEWKIDLG